MNKINRNVLEITMNDFDAHPVWCDFVDDDDVIYVADDEIDLNEGIYYCKSEFSTPINVKMQGYIRISDGEVMALAVWVNNICFEVYNLKEEMRHMLGTNPDIFAHRLGLVPEEIFPLKYHAQIGHHDIEGWVRA